ncbi:hypothetical protein D3C87_1746430 [compost metagenome]
MVLQFLLNLRQTGDRLLEQSVEEADMAHGDLERLHTGSLQRGDSQRYDLGIGLGRIVADKLHSGLEEFCFPSRFLLNRPEDIGMVRQAQRQRLILQ